MDVIVRALTKNHMSHGLILKNLAVIHYNGITFILTSYVFGRNIRFIGV